MPNFETSFIPEQGTTYQSGSRRSVAATVFSVLITVIALGLTGGAWWLQQQELKKVKALETDISNMESKFDIEKITLLGQMDKRIGVARDMFNKHSMPSLLIDYISDNTVSSIKWKSISYTRSNVAAGASDGSTTAGDVVELQGESVNYSPLYQQLSHFRTKCSEITNTELKSFRIDPRTNVVSIQIKLTVKPTFATFNTVRSRSTESTAAAAEASTNPTPTEVTPTVETPTEVTPVVEPIPVVNPAVTKPVVTPTQPKVVPVAPKIKPAVVVPPVNTNEGTSSMPTEPVITQ